MTPTLYPAIDATLNATAFVLLLTGFVCIKTGRRRVHAGFMIAAFGVSMLFLASYLAYHLGHPELERRFGGRGWIRPVYFSILITHILLAMAVPPLAVMTLWRAARGRFDRHRRLARWTWPIWVYVSLSGVIVYWMLYKLDQVL